MKHIHSLLIFLLLGFMMNAQTMGRLSLSSGGGTAVAGAYTYSYTIGEAIVGANSNGAIIITTGMQQPEQAGGLPIELLAFTAKLQEGVVQLEWLTNLEIQSDHFVIERSVDGITYEVIGEVKAAGYSDSPSNYIHNDIQAAHLGMSVLFYRLRQYDLDGEFSLSPTVQLSLSEAPTSLSSLFPNPASTEAFLRYQTEEKASPKCILSTAEGKVIEQKQLESGAGIHTIPVHDLSEGIYFVKFSSSKYQKTHRLIVTH